MSIIANISHEDRSFSATDVVNIGLHRMPQKNYLSLDEEPKIQE